MVQLIKQLANKFNNKEYILWYKFFIELNDKNEYVFTQEQEKMNLSAELYAKGNAPKFIDESKQINAILKDLNPTNEQWTTEHKQNLKNFNKDIKSNKEVDKDTKERIISNLVRK